MKMSNGNLVILGAGESGTGAALLGKDKGWKVFLSDKGTIRDIYRKELELHGISYEQGKHSMPKILAGDLIIKSPGISDDAPAIVEARSAGLPVISEIEFAWRYCEGTVIGITGSNGKTTTTSLVYHILHNAGFDCALGGNIGTSFARLVRDEKRAFYVLELSSFQLDGIDTFRPHISVITNITEDHLDRYDYKVENYIRSKFRIAMNQTARDHFIYCADDPFTTQYMQLLPEGVNRYGFTLTESAEGFAAFVQDQDVVFELKKKDSPCR